MTVRLRHSSDRLRSRVRSALPLTLVGVLGWLWLLVAPLLAAGAAEAQLTPQPELFVTNQRGEDPLTPADAVVVYGVAADGGLTFKRILRGTATQLDVPAGLAVTETRLIVANQGNRKDFAKPDKCRQPAEVVQFGPPVETTEKCGSITIYGRHASLDAPPTWVIKGPKSGVDVPLGVIVRDIQLPAGGIAKDAELIVANQTADFGRGSITVYDLRKLPPLGGTIDLPPERTITGGSTRLSGPGFIALSRFGELFVSNNYAGQIGGAVTVYPVDAAGDVTPQREIKNFADPFVDLLGVALDETLEGDVNEVFLAHGFQISPDAISVFRRDGIQAFASTRTITGGLDRPAGLVLPDRRLFGTELGKRLIIANQSRTTGNIGNITGNNGGITVYPRNPVVDPILPRIHPDAEDVLFSPVGLALVTAPSFDFTLTGPSVVDAPRNVPVPVTIRAQLLAGAGTVTFKPVESDPDLASLKVSVSPAPPLAPACTPTSTLPCDVTLTFTAAADAPLGSSRVTVKAVGVPAGGCGDLPDGEGCGFERPISFDLRVIDRPTTGRLQVQKLGDGSCTIRSVPQLGEGQPRIECGTGGTLCSGDFSVETVTLRVEDLVDSDFLGWDGQPNPNCGASLECRVPIERGRTTSVSARCDAIRRANLTVELAGSGESSGLVTGDLVTGNDISCKPTCSSSPRSGESVQLTASTPNGNARFDRWSGVTCDGGPTANPCVFRIEQDTTVTATFIRLVTLTVQIERRAGGDGTVQSVPAGIACPTDCTETYDLGTRVVLTATPDARSRVFGWSACAEDSNTCAVELTASTTVTVTFVRVVTLTVDKIDRDAADPAFRTAGSGNVTLNPQGRPCRPASPVCQEFDSGTRVTVVPNPVDGFAGCVATGGQSEERDTCALVLTDNVTVKPYFGSAREVFIARLYVNVLRAIPTADNTSALIDALVDQPSLVLEALLDAFFHGPRFQQRLRGTDGAPALSPEAVVNVVVRALLGRDPTLAELTSLDTNTDRLLTTIEDKVRQSCEFLDRYYGLFPTPPALKLACTA